MRRFGISPNKGIVSPVTSRPTIHTNAKSYRRPSPLLRRLDELTQGRKPEICISRRQGGLGDVLMTLPTVKAIANKYQVQVDYATDYDYLNGALPTLLKNLPYIRKVMPSLSVDRAEEGTWDIILDLTCPCIAHEQPLAPPVNRIDLFARHAGITLTDTHIDLILSEDEIGWARQELQRLFLLDRGYKIIVAQPSSSTTRRDAPIDLFKKILSSIPREDKRARILVLTHDSDSSQAKAVRWENFDGLIRGHNYTARQIAAILTFSNLTICPDSSVLHIAGALDKPTLSLFGPTDPRARINHYPKAVAIAPASQLTCSYCLDETSAILTQKGYKQIKDINVGDIVKTHIGVYNSVTQLHKNLLNQRKMLTIKGAGLLPLKLTEEHKVLKSIRYYAKGTTCFTKPEWVEASQLQRGDYLCIPRNKPVDDSLNTIFHTTSLTPKDLPLDIYWLLGLWVAEGWTQWEKKHRTYKVTFCINKEEVDILNKIKKINQEYICRLFPTRNKGGIEVKPNTDDGSIVVSINNQSFTSFIIELFGQYTKAENKKVPEFVFGLPDIYLYQFLQGANSGDGHSCTGTTGVYSTSSLELALGLQELATRFGSLTMINKYIRDTNFKKNATIYRLFYRKNPSRYRTWGLWYTIDDFILSPIRSIIEDKQNRQFVYDITVNDCPTFTANNIAVFDCWYKPTCGNRYTCWSRLEPNLCIQTALCMLNKQMLPSHPELIFFGSTTTAYEIL